MIKLVLFEDTNELADSLIAAIKQIVPPNGDVIRFDAPADGDGNIYEDRLVATLSKPPYMDASLIIADRDLSKTPGFSGLAEPTVRRVAHTLAIPECTYARTMNESEFLRAAEQRESCIAVSIEDEEKCAAQIIAIAQGFADIRERLSQLQTGPRRSPGRLLADVLGKPEYADKISLYASGDQNRLASVLRPRGEGNYEKLNRLTCLLGYWLWDSVLRYPGVIVNDVAASSYLNIHVDTFLHEADVSGVFEAARYAGPFELARGPLWWRGMLDDMVAAEDCVDGRAFVVKRLSKHVLRSECCEDHDQQAGYYCMLSNQPVSLKNSKGGLPWFPRGADLARVSTSQYDELGPWL